MARCWITVGLSDHRVETLGAAEAAMAGHRVVALEEPPTPGFRDMLASRISIGEHLEQVVPEFPDYSRRQCRALRRLHRLGVQIEQVDPFMAALEAIHDGFDRGGRPADLESDPVRWRVYQAERRWTGALLAYYESSADPDFERVLSAVCAFALADAARGTLRDAMRADQVVSLDAEGGVYVEAGTVHAGLIGQLRRRVPTGVAVRPLWLATAAVDPAGGRAPRFAPGDRLTLALNGRRRHPPDPDRARLLAARSLIHVAISAKEERLPSDEEPFPHAADEAATRRLVEALSLADCRTLYPAIRSVRASEARRLVERHLQSGRGHHS